MDARGSDKVFVAGTKRTAVRFFLFLAVAIRLASNPCSLYTIDMPKEKLVIIDGHALIHRAYHAIPPLTTKDGDSVNAVYGFTVILLNVLRDLKPKYIAIAFDLPGKTKRHDDFSGYKANRSAAPDDLVAQFDRVRKIAEAFNIPVISKEGYEADDIIGTIAKNSPAEIENYIVTGDLDELQLVDKKTKVYTMKRGFSDILIYDEKKVYERYGLTPKKFVDFKALKGDPSDNIPGVAGIGEKTAINLISEFGSLDNIYQNLDKIKPPIAEKLKKEKEIAYLSQKLSRIETDLKISFDLKKCLLADYDQTTVLSLFRDLGFNSLVNKIPESNKLSEEKKMASKLQNPKYLLIDTPKKLDALIESLKKEREIAVDTETTSKDQIEAELVGISLSFKEDEAYYLPLGHKNSNNLNKEVTIKKLQNVFDKNPKTIIGHNLKYDYVILKRNGLNLSGNFFDTMIGAYLLEPNLRAQKLSALAFSVLGLKITLIENFIGKGKEQLTFDQVPIEKALFYAAEDADIAFQLYKNLKLKLKEKDLFDLAEKIEFPLISILGDMELLGIKINKNELKKLSIETEKKITGLQKEIFRLAEEEFNISSPAQLQKILFEKLKIQESMKDKKDLKKLKSGGYSTSASELEKLRDAHPIVEKVFNFRELTKLKSTYIDTLPKLIKKDGRIHTSYNQAITQTGRLSSSEPNLQNIPTRTEEGKKIRNTFLADDGFLLLSADYSQIELRVVAHIANDKKMINVFNLGRDIHTETAAGIYGVADNEVTEKMRRAAKIVNFGILYGVSAHGLHQQVGIKREEGQRLIDSYFELYPKIKEYTEKIQNQARTLGYVETIFGRRRLLPEINSKNFAVRSAAERMAINMPVQGTAADLMKLAMIDITRELPKVSPKTKLLLQVHDELILEVPAKEIEVVAKFVKEKMNAVAKLSVPIETETRWGKKWGDLK